MLARLKAFLHSEKVHAEISEELQFHIEMKAADLECSGMTASEARIAAMKSFGKSGRIHEQVYDVRGGALLEDVWGDVRFASRLLRKQWVKTCILIATLALGIGVNSAVFGVVNSVLLQPLPFSNSSTLVVLHQSNHGVASGVSYPHFKDWQAGSHSFEEMAVYSAESSTLTDRGDATIIFGAIASSSLFRVLQVEPLRGRLFREEDDRFVAGSKLGGPILISDRLWRSRFNGSDRIIGQLITLDGRSFEIVGIISSRMAFPVQRDQVDYWKTVAVDADPALYGGTIPTSRGYPRYDAAIARLKAGVTLEQARQDMSLLAKRIAHDHPKATSSNEIAINSALDEVVGVPGRTMILTLYGAVFCVLLVSCMNVANLLLVDALARRREFSMRLALGAPALKIVRQLLIESTMVAIAGGIAGLSISWFVMKLFLALAPPETPRLNDIHLGGDVFFYVLAVSILGGVLFGCLPALSTRQLSLSITLKESDRSLTKGKARFTISSLLVCGQIILGMILTCCAGILVGNFQQILESDHGFNPHGVLTASINLPNARYGQSSQRVIDYYASLMRELSAVPGVESVAMAEVLPLSGQSNGTTVSVVGKTHAGKPSTDLRFVDPAYFQTLQMRLLSGRPFNGSDTAARHPFAIVNQAFVSAFLPDLDPLSSQIALGWGGDKARRVVGVVADVRHSATSAATVPEVYVPFAQFPLNDMSILLRTSGDPHSFTPTIRNIARSLDASVPLDRVRTLDEYLLLSAAQQRFLMWLLIAFACATMLLSAIGLYSVLSDSVLARSREFGIRLALGSSVSRIVGLVFRQGLGVTLAGMLIGAAASVFAARLLQHWLYDANTLSPRLFGVSCLVVILVAFAACLLPARKAAHVDPVSLLRSE